MKDNELRRFRPVIFTKHETTNKQSFTDEEIKEIDEFEEMARAEEAIWEDAQWRP
jgi:hypothetical protein